MVSPIYVANNLIRRATVQRDVELTHLKLQKLLYLIYAKYLVTSGESLFSSRFEAWQYGPVLSDIYEIFKNEGSRNLTDYRPDSNGKILVVTESGAFGECFDHVCSKYARKSASYLVRMTHGIEENPSERTTAWKQAVDALGIGAFMDDAEIKKDGEMWFAAG